MRLNHPDYIKLLLEAYRKKRANNELSFLSVQSTSAKIKKECLKSYGHRYGKKDETMPKKDEQILKNFLGIREDEELSLQVIRRFDPDKFKPLDKFLKKDTETTDPKNVELLAWLTDFEHRPWLIGKDFQLTDEEAAFIKDAVLNQPTPEPVGVPNEEEEPVVVITKGADDVLNKDEGDVLPSLITTLKKGEQKWKYIRAAIIFATLIICTGGIYAIWQQKKDNSIVCVYWANDHYQEVACEEEPRGRVIIPMSPERIKSFRRITRKDTITEWSIGKLYYIKNNNDIECYTEGGKYPEDMSRYLNVLTRHMFNKYLPNGKNAVDDSPANQAAKLTINK